MEGGPRGLSIHCQAGWPPVEPHGRSRFLRPLAPSPAAAAQGSCPPRSCPLSVPPPRPPGTPFLSTDPLLPSPRPSSGLAVPPPTRCPLAFPTQSLSAGVGSPPTPGCGPEVLLSVFSKWSVPRAGAPSSRPAADTEAGEGGLGVTQRPSVASSASPSQAPRPVPACRDWFQGPGCPWTWTSVTLLLATPLPWCKQGSCGVAHGWGCFHLDPFGPCREASFAPVHWAVGSAGLVRAGWAAVPRCCCCAGVRVWVSQGPDGGVLPWPGACPRPPPGSPPLKTRRAEPLPKVPASAGRSTGRLLNLNFR